MKSIKKLAIAGGTAMSALLASASNAMAADAVVTMSSIQPGTGYAKDLGVAFSSILNIIMLVAAILVFVYLIIGGITWLTSGGDKAKTEKARGQITAAIIGLVIIAASWAIFNLILGFLGFNSSNLFDDMPTINGNSQPNPGDLV